MEYVLRVRVATREDGSYRWVVLGTTQSVDMVLDFLRLHDGLDKRATIAVQYSETEG